MPWKLVCCSHDSDRTRGNSQALSCACACVETTSTEPPASLLFAATELDPIDEAEVWDNTNSHGSPLSTPPNERADDLVLEEGLEDMTRGWHFPERDFANAVPLLFEPLARSTTAGERTAVPSQARERTSLLTDNPVTRNIFSISRIRMLKYMLAGDTKVPRLPPEYACYSGSWILTNTQQEMPSLLYAVPPSEESLEAAADDGEDKMEVAETSRAPASTATQARTSLYWTQTT